MPCQRSAGEIRSPGRCCCAHCEEDRLRCHACCKCVPRYLCLLWAPDDAAESAQQGTLTHNGSGAWTGTAFGATVSLDADTCEWRVTSEALTVGGYNLDERFDVSGVGCRTPEITIENAVHEGNSGTLTITKRERMVVPIVRGENGCWERLCDECDCIPRCLCVLMVYRPTPYDDWIESKQIVCYDAADGGWLLDFPSLCEVPAVSGIIEIGTDQDSCSYLVTVDSLGASQEPPHDFFTTRNFCNGGSDWLFDIPDDSYGAQIGIIISERGCETGTCANGCCRDIPNTLTLLVQFADCFFSGEPACPGASGECVGVPCGELEITLTRDCETESTWSGSAIYPAVPLVPDTPCWTFAMSVQCVSSAEPAGNAFTRRPNGECVCCDENSDPAVNGCWLADFTITGGPVESFDGLSLCGVEGPSIPPNPNYPDGYGPVPSSVDPVYAEWHFISGGECSFWDFTLTE